MDCYLTQAKGSTEDETDEAKKILAEAGGDDAGFPRVRSGLPGSSLRCEPSPTAGTGSTVTARETHPGHSALRRSSLALLAILGKAAAAWTAAFVWAPSLLDATSSGPTSYPYHIERSLRQKRLE
ncbi:hypothetical protein HPP92_006475 [Vanilla planifolia]|uniref:Uncharacterized protein n=1 Tax=Vanilla planifolia TaxID=51239 RepID=A0A835R969_VANPL|nr:hypothetical protein HPP92_006736 [Vanilla planifolia]KAG0489612.1 hypothetical protein HPP92_006475 [Vanilla planifolia]